MSMSGLKKSFCITTNTPFQVQDLLEPFSNIKRTPRNVDWVTSTLDTEESLKFPKRLPRSFRQASKKGSFKVRA